MKNTFELLPTYDSIMREISVRELLGKSEKYTERVNKKLAHKVVEENVLLCQMELVEDAETYLFEVVNDCKHPFYYEHPIDHMSGSNMTEIALQGIKIILHLEGVEMSTQMALIECNSKFLKYVEHGLPLYMTAKVDAFEKLSQDIALASTTFCFIQGGDICAKLEIKCKTILKEKYAVLLQHRMNRIARLKSDYALVTA